MDAKIALSIYQNGIAFKFNVVASTSFALMIDESMEFAKLNSLHA